MKKNILVNDKPLKARYMTPPTDEPPDKRLQFCQVNTAPLIDVYDVNISEHELERHNTTL